jgi:3-oxoacyl-[acyl-carrier-protein] synthase-1
MVTGVGLSAPASCAAIRCAIDGFAETRFMDKGGEWIIGCQVPLDQPWRGRAKLVKMAVPAIRECLAGIKQTPTERIPLLLCVAEKDRPGRIDGLDDLLLPEIQKELGLKFHPKSCTIPLGQVGVAEALLMARRLIEGDTVAPYCVIAGGDSLLVAATLAVYEEKDRVLTSQNSDGFIPGEAGVAVLVGRPVTSARPQLLCLGIGLGREPNTIDSEEPLRADGLVQAIKAAMADSGRTLADCDYRLTDLCGGQYGFKEASLGLMRSFHVKKKRFELWHPADCIGAVGAAIGPMVLAVAEAAGRKDYAPGPGVLCHFSWDNPDRASLILRCGESRAA